MSNSREPDAEFTLSDPYSSYAGMNEATRHKKAQKIIAVLNSKMDLKRADVLDIGTGSGHIISLIARECRSATSVNLDDERVIKDGYKFVQVADVKLPFDDESFDVVISNQVIEHIPPQQQHLEEICRVLKKGGIAYIATPSKFTLIEPHFKLPFLSWLPKHLADGYVRLFKHKQFDVYPLTLGRLVRWLDGRMTVEDMTLAIIKNPELYKLDMMPSLQPLLKRLPLTVLKMLHPFIPSFVVLLHKK